MKLTRVLAISAIAMSMGLSAVHAQSISSNQLPAEFPPADFKGKQYVDSRGCVYIRAGVDGATTWVPRVTRDRKVICGFKPTFAAGQNAPTSAAQKLDKNVVQIQPAAPEAGGASATATAAAPKAAPKAAKPAPAAPKATAAAPAAVAAPKPTTTRTVKTAPKQAKGAPLYTTKTAARPKTTTTTTAAPKTATAPRTTAAPVVVKPAAVPQTQQAAPKTTTVRRTSKQPARAAGVVSPCREGVTSWKGSAVRCGPQALSPVTPGSGRPTAQPPKMRFDQNSSLRRPPVGTVVARNEVAPDVRVVPRHVWENNLNSLVDAPVPVGYRRAFDDGRLNIRRAVMTMEGQAQMEQLWTNTLPMRLVPVTVGDAEPVQTARRSTASGATVSTKSAPAAKSMRLAGTPYVQVGTFDDAASAQAAAKQVKRLGMPVRIGKYTRNGTTQRMVLAGPFSSADNANAALSKAQGAGFGSAFVRQ